MNGQAFPLISTSPSGAVMFDLGLTKRELIAAMAMQGMLSSWPEHAGWNPKETAKTAVAFADSLLAALENNSE